MTGKKEELMGRVGRIIASLRPYLVEDGGDMELVDITEEGIVQVRLLGACGECAMSTMTLKAGIEAKVKEMIPEIVGVEECM